MGLKADRVASSRNVNRVAFFKAVPKSIKNFNNSVRTTFVRAVCYLSARIGAGGSNGNCGLTHHVVIHRNYSYLGHSITAIAQAMLRLRTGSVAGVFNVNGKVLVKVVVKCGNDLGFVMRATLCGAYTLLQAGGCAGSIVNDLPLTHRVLMLKCSCRVIHVSMLAVLTYVQRIAALGTGRSNYSDDFIVFSSFDDQFVTCYFGCCLGICKVLVAIRAVPVFFHAVLHAGSFNGIEMCQSTIMITDLYLTGGQHVAQKIAFCNDNAMQLVSNVLGTDLISAFGCAKNCNAVQIPLIVVLENLTIKLFNHDFWNTVHRGYTGDFCFACQYVVLSVIGGNVGVYVNVNVTSVFIRPTNDGLAIIGLGSNCTGLSDLGAFRNGCIVEMRPQYPSDFRLLLIRNLNIKGLYFGLQINSVVKSVGHCQREYVSTDILSCKQVGRDGQRMRIGEVLNTIAVDHLFAKGQFENITGFRLHRDLDRFSVVLVNCILADREFGGHSLVGLCLLDSDGESVVNRFQINVVIGFIRGQVCHDKLKGVYANRKSAKCFCRNAQLMQDGSIRRRIFCNRLLILAYVTVDHGIQLKFVSGVGSDGDLNGLLLGSGLGDHGLINGDLGLNIAHDSLRNLGEIERLQVVFLYLCRFSGIFHVQGNNAVSTCQRAGIEHDFKVSNASRINGFIKLHYVDCTLLEACNATVGSICIVSGKCAGNDVQLSAFLVGNVTVVTYCNQQGVGFANNHLLCNRLEVYVLGADFYKFGYFGTGILRLNVKQGKCCHGGLLFVNVEGEIEGGNFSIRNGDRDFSGVAGQDRNRLGFIHGNVQRLNAKVLNREGDLLFLVINVIGVGITRLVEIIARGSLSTLHHGSVIVAQLCGENDIVTVQYCVERGNVDAGGFASYTSDCFISIVDANGKTPFVLIVLEYAHDARANVAVFALLILMRLRIGVEKTHQLTVCTVKRYVAFLHERGLLGQRIATVQIFKTFKVFALAVVEQVSVFAFNGIDAAVQVKLGYLAVSNAHLVKRAVAAVGQVAVLIHDVVDVITVDLNVNDGGQVALRVLLAPCFGFGIVVGYPDGVCGCTVYVRGIGSFIVAVVGGNAKDVVVGVLCPSNVKLAVIHADLRSIFIIRFVFQITVSDDCGCGCRKRTVLALGHGNVLQGKTFRTSVGIGCFACRQLLSLLRINDMYTVCVLIQTVGSVTITVIFNDYILGITPTVPIPYRIAELSTVVLVIVLVVGNCCKIDLVEFAANIYNGCIRVAFRHLISVCKIEGSYAGSGMTFKGSAARSCAVLGFNDPVRAVPDFEFLLMPQEFDVCTKLTVKLPTVNLEFGENIKIEDRAKLTVYTHGCDRTAYADRCFNGCAQLNGELFDADTLVKFEHQLDLSLERDLNLKRNGDDPDHVLRVVLEGILDRTCDRTGCKANAVSVIFKDQLSFKSKI